MCLCFLSVVVCFIDFMRLGLCLSAVSSAVRLYYRTILRKQEMEREERGGGGGGGKTDTDKRNIHMSKMMSWTGKRTKFAKRKVGVQRSTFSTFGTFGKKM